MRRQGLQGLIRVGGPALLVPALFVTVPLMTAPLAPGALASGDVATTGEPATEQAQAQAAPIADVELGLSRGSVFDVPSPPPVVENEAEPGESVRLPRAYPGAPALVPHAVADLLPITRRDNLCLDCHAVEIEEPGEGEPTPIPESHYLDLRNAPGVRRDAVAGARYNCLSCHAAPTAAAPLVGDPGGS